MPLHVGRPRTDARGEPCVHVRAEPACAGRPSDNPRSSRPFSRSGDTAPRPRACWRHRPRRLRGPRAAIRRGPRSRRRSPSCRPGCRASAFQTLSSKAEPRRSSAKSPSLSGCSIRAAKPAERSLQRRRIFDEVGVRKTCPEIGLVHLAEFHHRQAAPGQRGDEGTEGALSRGIADRVSHGLLHRWIIDGRTIGVPFPTGAPPADWNSDFSAPY